MTTSSDYIFGCHDGFLSRKIVSKIEAATGATHVNYSDSQCKCGYGCAPGDCRASRRGWWTADNIGEPHNSRIAAEVAKLLK